MDIADTATLNALWPRDHEGRHAPRPLARALVSLCAGRQPDALYCQRDGFDESSKWRVLALAGDALVEIRGVGDDLSAAESDARFRRVQTREEPLEMARCVSVNSAVHAVNLISSSEDYGDELRWTTRWKVELDSGACELPSDVDARTPRGRETAEAFVLTALTRLQQPLGA